MSRIIFIVGRGRSGTNLVGQIIATNTRCHVGIEEQPLFKWITAMAVDAAQEARLLPDLIGFLSDAHATLGEKQSG
jgi:hypothetical protein